MTIVVTGGSGYIGTLLTKQLLNQNHTVIVVDRSAPRFTHKKLYFIAGDLSTAPLPYNSLERTDAVINLAGSSIFRRWTPVVQEDIRASRINSTQSIVESIASATSRPPVFICASATGFYGETEEVIDEKGVVGNGFLASVVHEWETTAHQAAQYGVRVVSIRTAPVIGKGGIIAALTTGHTLRTIARITKKNFLLPWIHEKDIVKAYLFALETSTLQGVVNACAPNPVRYQSLMKLLARKYKSILVGTIPSWIMKRMLGGLFDEITYSTNIIPQRLLDKGFIFTHNTIESALDDLAS